MPKTERVFGLTFKLIKLVLKFFLGSYNVTIKEVKKCLKQEKIIKFGYSDKKYYEY